MEEGGEGGKRKGGRGTETEGGGGQEREGKNQGGGGVEKSPRTERSDTETEAGGEAGTSQSCYKKVHMTNIYLTVSDEEAIVDFVKDHEELYYKTNKHFKDKARKECLWERFANSRKLSVKVCKTWFKSQRTCYGKLNRDQHAVNRHHITASTSYQPHHSFRALFGQPAGHGPVHTDENNTFCILQAKAGDNMYSLLQRSRVKSGGISRERLSDIYKQSCKAS